MIGIGFDTGGTYTDAVVYDLSSLKILVSSKALTTKSDLKIGIQNTLAAIPKHYLTKCESLSLSTTLATNACVENKGGKGKLVLIGLNRYTLKEAYQEYGIESLEDVYLLPCHLTSKPSDSTPPNWDLFRKELPNFLAGCDCISVVQLFAREHFGQYEKEARAIIQECLDVPVILGHDLFPDRNILRRGAGALLNARLIPVIHEFLAAVRNVFHSHGLDLPLIIMRSDGNLMSDKYTLTHPVETLLCGPAASIIGARHLANQRDAIIVDMGGTTTDVAIVKDAEPLSVLDGIQIGSWKTFVKGLYVDTFALGGDTAIHYDYDGVIYLESYRIMPLCILATNYPQVLSQLDTLKAYPNGHTFPLYEFFLLIKIPSFDAGYTQSEQSLCNALKAGPLIYEEAAKAFGTDFYSLNTTRLEADGIVLRAGLTPTDIMHIRGDFTDFNRAASLAGANFICDYSKLPLKELCDSIYNLVEERLYCNLVRILLTTEYPSFHESTPDAQLADLIRLSYTQTKNGEAHYFQTLFTTKASLVGVGAPTHLFLPAIAKLLHTNVVIPPYAAVANAVGAIVGNIAATAEAELRPCYEEENLSGFRVITVSDSKYFRDYEAALTYAYTRARGLAIESAKRQGALEPLTLSDKKIRKEAPAGTSSILLSECIRTTAVGSNQKNTYVPCKAH